MCTIIGGKLVRNFNRNLWLSSSQTASRIGHFSKIITNAETTFLFWFGGSYGFRSPPRGAKSGRHGHGRLQCAWDGQGTGRGPFSQHTCSNEKLKMLAFRCRHCDWTSRPFPYLILMDGDTLDYLRQQKEEEDRYFELKDGDDPLPLPQDTQTVAKSLAKAK